MPALWSIRSAACAPVRPVAARTREYFLNAERVLKLAHSDNARPGRMNRKYIGSNIMVLSFSPAPAKAPCKAYNAAGGAGISPATLPGPVILSTSQHLLGALAVEDRCPRGPLHGGIRLEREEGATGRARRLLAAE